MRSQQKLYTVWLVTRGGETGQEYWLDLLAFSPAQAANLAAHHFGIWQARLVVYDVERSYTFGAVPRVDSERKTQ
jgi:hypothetical protein